MTYLHRQAAKRKDPTRILPGARVAVVTLTNYWHGSTDPGAMPRGSQALAPFRILSPQNGDRYALPIGVDPRYATLALRAAGGSGAVRWFVDGRPVAGERWALAPGRHAIRAETVRGERDEVRIDVR